MTTRRISRGKNLTSVSKDAVKSISDLRRADISSVVSEIESEKLNGRPTAAIAHSRLFKKVASFGQTALPTTSSHSERMGPEVYSPLFQLANLNLPRDRVTMNAWNRVFYDTHPIVRNAINLHASYPISKINITCKSKKVQQFFVEMAEEIDLYSAVYGAALEFWKMGECFPYAELDRNRKVWKRITILNPDYINVEKPSVGNKTSISLRPDSSLMRLVKSNSPKDMHMKGRIPKQILEYVKKGMNIPLEDFNISHLKLLSSPYDVRGTSVIVSIYKDLMLYDKLRESKFAQADGMINPLTLVKVGGSDGYRPTQADLEAYRQILEEAQYDKDYKLVTHDGVEIERVGYQGGVLDIAGDIDLINNNIYTGLMVPKALMDQESACLKVSDNEILTEENGWVFYDDLKDTDKVATLNPEDGQLEFHAPTFKKDYEFTGMMYRFQNQEVDVEVTDFHEMYFSRDNGLTYSKEKALNIFDIDDINSDVKFSSRSDKNIRFKTSVDGWAGVKNSDVVMIPNKEQYTGIESLTEIPLDDWLELAGYYLSEGHLRWRYKDGNKTVPLGIDVTQQTDGKGFSDMSKLFDRLPYNISVTGSKSRRRSWNVVNKKLAEYMLSDFGEKSAGKRIPQWMKNLPKRELDILLKALVLGDGHVLKNSSSGTSYYSIISKQLADDVQEIAFKAGYATKARWETKNKDAGGEYASICKIAIFKKDEVKRGPLRKTNPIVRPTDVSINWVNNERVFCVEVPNHIFVTRSNGKIAIHGNTYASSSVGLEVLRQRYDIFRNMIKKWLEQKIFAPICELQDFFEYVDGEKRLVVPQVDFNHMNLYDVMDYVQNLSNFVSSKQVSLHTLYRSLGVSYEEEQRRLRVEAIDEVIRMKEQEAMAGMRLSELRTLDPEKAIPEPAQPAAGGGMSGAEDGLPGMGGLPGMDGGAPPGLPGLGGPPEGGMGEAPPPDLGGAGGEL